MESLMQLPTWLLVIIWWLCGFIPGLWAASSARRHSNRDFPSISRQLHWNDLLMPAWMSIGGPIAGLIHIVVAIIFELGERHWFDFMDRPIFPKKDK